MLILLCYDGSPDAKAAVRAAGRLFDGSTAIVVTVWEGLTEVVSRAEAGFASSALDFEAIDRAQELRASRCTEEGAGYARAAGLAASGLPVRCGPSIAQTILDQAAAEDADMIVLGTRGRGALKSVVMGSVSRAVLQHADRPVLVVSPPEGLPPARTHGVGRLLRRDDSSGHGPRADADPPRVVAGDPAAQPKVLQAMQLRRIDDGLGRSPDDDAPAATARDVDVVDLKPGPRGVQQSIELAAHDRTEHDGLRGGVKGIVDRSDHRQ